MTQAASSYARIEWLSKHGHPGCVTAEETRELAEMALITIPPPDYEHDPDAPDPRDEMMREVFEAGRQYQAEVEFRERGPR